MSGLFDGLASVLNAVFGAPVTLRRAGRADLVLQGLLRAPPVALLDEDGHAVLDQAPVLRVPGPAAAQIAPGDLVLPGEGPTYRVLSRQPGGSPAADAFVAFELEAVP